jgi:hypothetical protein
MISLLAKEKRKSEKKRRDKEGSEYVQQRRKNYRVLESKCEKGCLENASGLFRK